MNKKIIYLDNASTTHKKPKNVVSATKKGITKLSVNSSRGNKKFGTASGYYNPYNVNGSGQDYRGDTARIIFYLFTRYSQSDSYGFTAIAQSLDLLLEWNKIDPVTPHEEHRNEVVYAFQGNRNPFIDYPEFADMIWK